MSEGKTFNFGSVAQTATGQGSVNQIGDNTATVNNTDQKQEPIKFVFSKILEAIPEPEQAKIQEEVLEPIKEEIAVLAAMPAEESSEHEVQASFMTRVTELVSPLAPYADKISAGLISFAETGLNLVAPPAGWAIACTLAAIKAIKPSTPS